MLELDSAAYRAAGILPAPRAVQSGEDWFDVPPDFTIFAPLELRDAARWWREVSQAAFDVEWRLQISGDAGAGDAGAAPGAAGTTQPGASSPTQPGAFAVFELAPDLPREGYELRITGNHVSVRAADSAGAHHAAQVLRQLAGPEAFRRAAIAPSQIRLPHVAISDHPEFAWRGVLLDVARHFMPKHDVLRFIDLAAAHRLNTLHLHLTDDQGWRIEIMRYPRLTEVGSWRSESGVGTWRAGQTDGRPHGGYYTQDDLMEIVAYARQRGITVVPEIGSPGHVQAAVAAYPWLGVTGEDVEVRAAWGISDVVLNPNERSLQFFRDVIDEVVEIFDSPWVCIGGDEVPTHPWRSSEEIQRQATELGLADVRELHGWFLGEVAKHVVERGRRPAVWDEGLGPLLPPEAMVLSWRGMQAGADALTTGHDVVMCPEQFVYLDHREGDGPNEPVPVGFLRTVDDVHGFDLVPEPVQEALAAPRVGRLLGAQAQVWTEHLDSARRVDYATYPRLAAFADAVWRAPGGGDLADFRRRLFDHHLARLDAAGVEYRPQEGPHPWQERPGVAGWPRDLAAEWAAAGWAGAGGWHEEPEDLVL